MKAICSVVSDVDEQQSKNCYNTSKQLGQALKEWLRTAEGPVATSALELRIAECRLLQSMSR